MGLLCHILLNKTEEGVFKAGQTVAGIVKYYVNKDTKFESITLSLIGRGKCQWSETDSDNNSIYYSNKEEYVSIHKNLLTERKGANVIPKGTYQTPFEFLLPENIPPSLKNKTCTIAYKIIAKFVKANLFSSSKKFDAEVTVYGYVSPLSSEPLVFGLQKDLFSLTSKQLATIKAELNKTCLTPGENIKLTLTVNNDSNVPLKAIKTELVKYFTYISSGKSKKIEKETVKTTTSYFPTVPEKNVKTFSCVIPTLPSLYSIQNSKILTGEYKVKVTAKFPFPHTNVSVEVPVVIGETKDQIGNVVIACGDEEPSCSKMTEDHEINMNG